MESQGKEIMLNKKKEDKQLGNNDKIDMRGYDCQDNEDVVGDGFQDRYSTKEVMTISDYEVNRTRLFKANKIISKIGYAN